MRYQLLYCLKQGVPCPGLTAWLKEVGFVEAGALAFPSVKTTAAAPLKGQCALRTLHSWRHCPCPAAAPLKGQCTLRTLHSWRHCPCPAEGGGGTAASRHPHVSQRARQLCSAQPTPLHHSLLGATCEKPPFLLELFP